MQLELDLNAFSHFDTCLFSVLQAVPQPFEVDGNLSINFNRLWFVPNR